MPTVVSPLPLALKTRSTTLKRDMPMIPSVVPPAVKAVEITAQAVMAPAVDMAAAVAISERCSPRCAPVAVRILKYPSSPEQTDRCIAATVMSEWVAASGANRLY